MIEKVDVGEGLKKMHKAIAAHFHKAAAHHDAMAALHKDMGEHCKAKCDSMDDGDVHKAFFGKSASHHVAKADLHKAHGDHLRAAATELEAHAAEEDKEKAQKAAGVDPGAAAAAAGSTSSAAVASSADPNANSQTSVDAMIRETTQGLVKTSLEMLKTDSTVQDEIRKMVIEGVRTALGDKTIPDHVRVIGPAAPQGATLIGRDSKPINTDNIDPKLADMVGA